MNRREYLRELAALGASLSIPISAIETASETEIDAAWNCLQASKNIALEEHPRIALLRCEVMALDADESSKDELLKLIEAYREKFIDGSATPYEGFSDLETLFHYSPGMALEVSLFQMGIKQAQENAIANEKEYQRVHGLIGDIQTSNWFSKNNKRPSLPKGIPCSRNAIFGADLSLCVEYLRPLNLIPVCDSSVSIITNSSFPCTHPEFLEVFDWVVFTGVATLEKIAQEDSRIVWISCGTSLGLPLRYKDCKISQSLTDGRVYGIVGGSAFNGGYAGLTLYEWNSVSWENGHFGRQIAKFNYGEAQSV